MKSLNKINDDAEIIVVARNKGKNGVVMVQEEYNSLLETLHITKLAANRKRLDESIEEMEKGKNNKHSLIDKQQWNQSSKPISGKIISTGISRIKSTAMGK